LKLLIAGLLSCFVMPLLARLSAQTADSPMTGKSTIAAAKLRTPLDAEGFPQPSAWEAAAPIRFEHDWQGQNPDPQRQTEVRVLWSKEWLYLKFRASYRDLYIFTNRNQRQPQLWNRDVAEVFLQAPEESGHHYTELEISPNGNWLDLKIADKQTLDLNASLKSRVHVDAKQNAWTAELAVPIASLTAHFDPTVTWRVNFFRVEGPEPNRFYSSWQPTNTPQPNFHVPQVFATLKFDE